ncbi:hypothetical protein [Olivibacter domesticus]|uniref:hypothetical protein n=1 Tax=Olivibacter domesticus TaxID=407022 RepID=UPI00360BD653
MAQQESIIKLKGKIWDLTFYKTKTGYQARQATGVSADRIANDPKFQRTRENNAEFGRGGVAAKKLRDVLRPMILLTYDTKMPNRLFSRIMRVLRADAVNDRGERKVLTENLGLLRQFGFNVSAQLSNTLFVELEPSIERTNGSVTLDIPTLVPALTIAAPQGTTHYQFNLDAAVVDFDNETASVLAMAESDTNSLKAASFTGESLNVSLPAASTLPILVDDYSGKPVIS